MTVAELTDKRVKLYTNESQTAKLIELGFEKPKGWYVDGVTNNINLYVNIDENPMMFNYSIGELLSFLPTSLDGVDYYSLTIRGSKVMYCDPYLDWIELDWEKHEELIDNLFDACIELKEEGVI
jgi:hypothetical protein